MKIKILPKKLNMKKDLTKILFIVLSTMFILSSCGESVNKDSTTGTVSNIKNVTATEEWVELKAKWGEATISGGDSNFETPASEEPIIN